MPPRSPKAIERTSYGYRLTLPDYGSDAGLAREVLEQVKATVTEVRPFGLLVDARAQRVHPPEVSAVVQEIMDWNKAHGQQRSCVVGASATARMQIMRLARSTGVAPLERYLDASAMPDWEARALAWIVEGAEPDDAG